MNSVIVNSVVVGAGTMGAGIAEVLAKAGHQVTLYDLNAELTGKGLERISRSLARAQSKGKLSAEEAEAAVSRITQSSELDAVKGCGLVVEAAPEKMELKKEIFSKLGELSASAVLASNTSSLSVTEIAAATPNSERVVGMHFFNPAPVMPLLEIVRAEQTSEETLQRCRELAVEWNKEAIVVRDVAGFATSRLGIILGMEAIRMVESGVASAEDIDKAMELGYRHPMGPLKLTDLVGLDVRLSIAEHLTRELGPQFTPPPLLRRMVRAGYLGKKTGRGFYTW